MVSDIQFNSPSKPFASWSIQQLNSQMVMGDDDLIYSHKGEIELGDEVLLTVRMLNEGEIYGFANVTLTEIHSDGSTRTLTTIPELIEAAPGEVGSMQFGWAPDRLGHVWVVVSVDGEQTVTGDSIHVVDPGDADGVLGQLEERGLTQQFLMVLAVMAVLLGTALVGGIIGGLLACHAMTMSLGIKSHPMGHAACAKWVLADTGQYRRRDHGTLPAGG